MEKLVIEGGTKLSGTVTISGAKNAAVAILSGTLLVEGISRVENIPDIADIHTMVEIIRTLGATVTYIDASTIEVDATNIKSHVADFEQVQKMRGSYYLLGVLIGRFRRAAVAMPGGCDFGTRPIDQHIKGFTALGAPIEVKGGLLCAETDRLTGANVYLDKVSVGATINIMLAACLAQGTTTIENAAKEPHIVDIANFLNAMGAKIRGAGTNVIRITGVDKMKGGTYAIIPDQIEAGTFMIAAAATGGDVTISNVIPKHMESLTAKLIECGVHVQELDDAIRVFGSGKPLKSTTVLTMPYPGFPTDLQPQMVALLTCAQGLSVVVEGVWDNRFQYVDELRKMGAQVRVDGRSATIEGVKALSGARVRATDLRGGAAMVIAGLCAEGTTQITELRHIDRGYEHFEDKLVSLGAKIQRVHYND